MADRFVPTQDDISEAIEARNAELISKYALSLDFDSQYQAERLPELIEAASNSQRDLDICTTVIKNHDKTIKLMQSILRQLRP